MIRSLIFGIDGRGLVCDLRRPGAPGQEQLVSIICTTDNFNDLCSVVVAASA